MRVVSPLSKPLVGAGVAPLMFRCAIVVGLVFLLRMSKSESAPLMPVRTEQRGGAAAVQEAEKDQQLVEAAAPAAAARQQRGIRRPPADHQQGPDQLHRGVRHRRRRLDRPIARAGHLRHLSVCAVRVLAAAQAVWLGELLRPVRGEPAWRETEPPSRREGRLGSVLYCS